MKKFASILMVLLLVGACMSANGQADASASKAPVEEVKPVLTFMTVKNTVDMSKEQPFGLYKGVTGYDINWESLNDTQQLMLIVASGEKKDMITVNDDQLSMMLAEGAAMDITDLLKEYGPEIIKGIPTLWPTVTVDGRIYGIPSTKASAGFVVNFILGRIDLLDAAEIKVGNDIDSFYQTLLAIKKAYPDMIPLGLDNQSANSQLVTTLMSAFGITAEWNMVDGTIVPYFKHPAYKDYLAFMTKLYKEGLMDADMPALTRRDKFTKFSSGKMVLMNDSWDGCRTYVQTLHEDVPTSVVEPIPFLADKNGQRHVAVPYGPEHYAVIPANSENAIHTIKAINEIYKPENQVLLAAGEEGVHWTAKAGGGYQPIQPKFNDDKINAHLFFTSLRNETCYNLIWQARLEKNADMLRIAVNSKALADQCEEVIHSPVSIAPSVTVVDNYSSLMSYMKDGIVQIISGKEHNGYLENLVSYWDKEGGLKVEEFYNTWYKKTF